MLALLRNLSSLLNLCGREIRLSSLWDRASSESNVPTVERCVASLEDLRGLRCQVAAQEGVGLMMADEGNTEYVSVLRR
jgi:hypothetical protein